MARPWKPRVRRYDKEYTFGGLRTLRPEERWFVELRDVHEVINEARSST